MKDGLPRRFRFALDESIETSFDGGEKEIERLGATGSRGGLEEGVEDAAGAAKGGEGMGTSFGRSGGRETVDGFGETSEGDADELSSGARVSSNSLRKGEGAHLIRRRSMITLDDLFSKVGMALARADAVEKVAREGMKRLGLLGVLQRVVEVESLEAGLDLDLGDGESPHGQSRKEEIPVLGRDEVGRRG